MRPTTRLREIPWFSQREARVSAPKVVALLFGKTNRAAERETETIEAMGRTKRNVLAATLLLWVALAVIAASWRVHSVLSGPRDSGETYVYTTSFQLFAFAYAELPWLLLLLCFVLGCEYLVWRTQSQGRPN